MFQGHTADIYGVAFSPDGMQLASASRDGTVRVWGVAEGRELQALTGQREMDATAILDYFGPLKKWLDDQNKGKPVGW